MKKWAYYGELKEALEDSGLTVNVLPERRSLLEHLADVQKSPVPGRRRQSADAFCSWYRNSLRLALHLHQPMGDL